MCYSTQLNIKCIPPYSCQSWSLAQSAPVERNHSMNKEVWDIKAIQSTSGGRLSVYRILKPNPGPETWEHLPMSVRRVVTGLRMGYLPLEVETGRYTGTPYEQRICKLCKSAPEDQEHFLLICPALADLRTILFSKVSRLHPDFLAAPTTKKLSCLLSPQASSSGLCHTMATMYMKRQSLLLKC